TFAARRLSDMAENTTNIVAIELLAACQGIDFRAPLRTSPTLQRAYGLVRDKVKRYDRDRFFAPDVAAIANLVRDDVFLEFVPGLLP
ncbi:MAG: hutH, partial [Rhodospirillales bacterium]|nr:hutH [Rhodospirillales bacterium]